MPRKVRDYKDEYKQYQGTTEQKKRRAFRNKIRRKYAKEGKVHKHDGKDIDHKNHDVTNATPKNLRVVSKSTNRSYARRSDGTAKGSSEANYRKRARLGDS
jgi:hypothetical protein